jgi:hypothetical protein
LKDSQKEKAKAIIKGYTFNSGIGVGGVRSDSALGRLSFKVEAAGKLRVFAMVDS